MVGAHLDSVPEGPGIQDNGTGSAVILKVAEAMTELNITPRNRVRFAFWGAEEAGLRGSQHYVNSLGQSELGEIALNLNFDMLGSPNYVRFVYDGDGSQIRHGTGTDRVSGHRGGLARLLRRSRPSHRTDGVRRPLRLRALHRGGDPGGRPLQRREDAKTEAEEGSYGGVADLDYDPCYHAACDSLKEEDQPPEVRAIEDAYGDAVVVGNVNMQALEELAAGAAHATLVFAEATSAVAGTEKGDGTPTNDLLYKGSKAQR